MSDPTPLPPLPRSLEEREQNARDLDNTQRGSEQKSEHGMEERARQRGLLPPKLTMPKLTTRPVPGSRADGGIEKPAPLPIREDRAFIERERPLDDLGRMSAEAVVAEHEAAAKTVEDMGDTVKAKIAEIQAMLMKDIVETATAIREKGQNMQAKIEEASALSNTIRDTCGDIKRKVAP